MVKVDKSSEADATAALLKLKQKEQVSRVRVQKDIYDFNMFC